MLCLLRKRDERIVINTSDGPIEIMVTEGRAVIGIKAPPECLILRGELVDLAKQAQKVFT